MIRLLFTSSRTPFDAVIRAFEGGTASHVGIDLGGLVVDSAFLQGGVKAHTVDAFLEGRRLVHAVDVTLPDEPAAAAFLADQIGKGYDPAALVGFLAWRDWQRSSRWYCSELAAAALLVGGWTLADRHARIGVRLLREIVHARTSWSM